MGLDDAFANAAYIPDGDSYPAKWTAAAASFRAQSVAELGLPYGESARECVDLFHPPRLSRGLLVFVHGGYWLRFDKSFWSHLAAGPLAEGWTVAMPSYDLCPDVRISEIGQQIDKAITYAAARIQGPIRLAGHSAGGQLVARAAVARPGQRWQDRLEKVVPISAVTDLAPLMETAMNADLRIDAAEAESESPVNMPAPRCPVTVWVGADERPVFLEQSAALAKAWNCNEVVVPDHHHFSVIEDLADPASALTQEIIAPLP